MLRSQANAIYGRGTTVACDYLTTAGKPAEGQYSCYPCTSSEQSEHCYLQNTIHCQHITRPHMYMSHFLQNTIEDASLH